MKRGGGGGTDSSRSVHIVGEQCVPTVWKKLSLQWIQQGSPSEVLLWVLQENSISVLKDEVLYIKEEIVVKVSVDNVAVIRELKPNHEEADTRMLVHTSYALEHGASYVLCL